MSKTYIIGDLHGNYLAFKEILDTINFDYENDTLISLGDIVDGWPQTVECIELLKKIKNLILIKGNHDEWALKYLEKHLNEENFFSNWNEKNNYMAWLHHGGQATVDSYLNGNNIEFLEKHIDFLDKALNYYIDDENNLFIHAGYEGIIPEKDKNFYDSSFLWTRQYVYNKLIYPRKDNQYKGDKNFNKVFIGHTPTLNFDEDKDIDHNKIINTQNIYLMDCGIAFYGYLACMNLDTKEVFYSSKTGWEYYPDFKGRNKMCYNDYLKQLND